MKSIIKNIIYYIKMARFLPHILVYYTHSKKQLLEYERNFWIKTIKHQDIYTFKNFLWLLEVLPEYRSVFYLRVGKISGLLRIFASGRESLYLNIPSERIAPGLVMQHGFSTIAEVIKIGKNCQIWHNVTIGTNKSGSGNKVTIGDNVKICAGAIVLGKITIGNNVTIGAGAVVVKSVPDDCVVVGNPSYIVNQNGQRVNIKL